ncbi:hypothetical protein, partial [Caballeronia choica]|uniref:hypothetical protein n=1 Tax=Caballeronia choica TaxID=326476 RepID=UPI001F391856
LSFFVRQLHWRCMAASAHPVMIIEAVTYSTYLQDVVLVDVSPYRVLHECHRNNDDHQYRDSEYA